MISAREAFKTQKIFFEVKPEIYRRRRRRKKIGFIYEDNHKFSADDKM